MIELKIIKVNCEEFTSEAYGIPAENVPAAISDARRVTKLNIFRLLVFYMYSFHSNHQVHVFG